MLKFTLQPGGQSDMVWCYSGLKIDECNLTFSYLINHYRQIIEKQYNLHKIRDVIDLNWLMIISF